MTSTLEHIRDWIVDQATRTRPRALITRYLGPLVFLGMLIWVIPQTPLNGPVGGVIALVAIVTCCWYAGPGPALLIPGFIALMSRVNFSGPSKPMEFNSREMLAFVAMTMLTGAVGIAGQYRRRFLVATRRHKARIKQHVRALNAARILFRELDGRITTWTDGAEKLFGWTSDEATGKLIHELLQTKFPKTLDEIHHELIANQQWHGEVVQRCRDGRELIIATHWILYRDDERGTDSVAEVHNDVTELRRAEAAVRESERRKDLFIATLAHELRNPLAPIRNGLQCLRLLRETQEDVPIYEIMERQLEHMVRLVDDLLDVSRINTGKVQLRLEQVVLRQIIDDAVAACRPQIEAAKHELTIRIPAEPVYLNADPARLAQVLTNLLQNASKFTESCGHISLTADCVQQQVEISVKDSGVGIPKEALPRVFDVFAQVQDVRTRTKGGLGLGLSIVKSLVEMHGGTVEVQSEGLGQGTEFTIRLPILIHHETPSPVEISIVNEDACANALRVLVVDDNQDAAETMAQALNMLGCACRSAFDGFTALKLAEEFEPDAFVLDLGMPGMSGFDLARRLRENARFQTSLLIAVTGWDKEDDRRSSKQAGFDHHFAKPVDLCILKDLLQPSSDSRDTICQ